MACKSKIDVIFLKGDESQLQLFQFPCAAKDNVFNNSSTVGKVKLSQNKYEFDVPLDTKSANYSRGRAACLSGDEHSHVKTVKLVSKPLDYQKQFCVGVFKSGKLYLTAVTNVIQLVPGFHHMDELDKLRRKKAAAAASQKVAEESCSSQDESAEKTQAKKALAITVKFGKNESEEAKAKRKQTYYYLKQTWDEEPWQPLTILKNSVRTDILSKLWANPSCSTTLKTFDRTDYLKCLLPRLDDSLQQSKRKEPYAPSSELNVEGLRNMSLVSKITAILSSASVVKYSQLITLLGNKAEKDSIISCLKQLAVLVRGCWVLSSEKLYPDNSVSSACGVSAPLMRRGRDYILWKMNRCGYVMRKEMCSHTKLPGEEVRGILEKISELNSETGWEFIYPIDTYFLETNKALRDEYIGYWNNHGKQLCDELGLVFKHDHSPTRHRSRNSNDFDSVSPGSGEKKRRRRDSTRQSIQEETLNMLTSNEVGELRRWHSSPNESSAVEKFLTVEEIKIMQNRMGDFLMVKASDFRAILSQITKKHLSLADCIKAARDLDFYEVSVKGETKAKMTMAYCVRPVEFSEDETLLMTRCTSMFTSKGFINRQAVPKLIEGVNVDKTLLQKILGQLCDLKDKRWVPKYLGVSNDGQTDTID